MIFPALYITGKTSKMQGSKYIKNIGRGSHNSSNSSNSTQNPLVRLKTVNIGRNHGKIARRSD